MSQSGAHTPVCFWKRAASLLDRVWVIIFMSLCPTGELRCGGPEAGVPQESSEEKGPSLPRVLPNLQ